MDITVTRSKPRLSRSKTIKVTSSFGDDKADINIHNFIDIWQAGKELQSVNSDINIIIDISDLDPKFRMGFLNRAVQGLYTFDVHKTAPHKKRNIFFVDQRLSKKQEEIIVEKLIIANKARDLANEPSNMSTPSVFCDKVVSIVSGLKHTKTTVYTRAALEKSGFGLILAVGNGSINQPRLLVIDYNPPTASKCVCLVGKGVTMDTGGYSLKRKDNIYSMHLDDTGASVVVGILQYLAQNSYPDRVVAICPMVENAVSDKAIKPGDVVTAYNKKTVEIVNTDAEGRLILADALSFACSRYKPDVLIDFATLTGWSSNLHCHTSYAYFTLNEAFSNDIIRIGEEVAERSMRIPPWIEYMKYASSHVADLKNFNFTNCQNSDGFMASMFLLHFIPKKYRDRWVHFDIKHQSLHKSFGMAEGLMTGLEFLNTLILKLNTKRAISSNKSP